MTSRQAPKPAEAVRAVLDGEAGRALRAALDTGRIAAAGGVPGSGAALLAGALREARGGTLLCLTEGVAEAEEVLADLAAFLPDPADRALLPAWPPGETPDAEALAARLAVLTRLVTEGRPLALVVPLPAALAPVVPPSALRRNRFELRTGATLDREALGRWLGARGYVRVPLAQAPGEWSVRGAVVDVAPHGALPVRAETDGDTIVALRRYDPVSQRSTDAVEAVAITALDPAAFYRPTGDESGSLLDYLVAPGLVAAVDPDRLDERLGRLAAGADPAMLRRAALLAAPPVPHARVELHPLPRPPGAPGADFHWRAGERLRPGVGVLAGLVALARRRRAVVICASTPADAARAREWVGTSDAPELAGVAVVETGLSTALELPDADLAFVPLPRVGAAAASAAASVGIASRRRAIADWLELKPGDYVVHRHHGVGRYLGLTRQADVDGRDQDYLALEFHGGTTLYVPVTAVDLVQKYVGAGDRAPALSALGGKAWGRRTAEAREAAEKFAERLLAVQALRQKGGRAPYPPDLAGVRGFIATFPYTDTPDQVRATEEILTDLTAPNAMDRLLTGDVGYGKTEIALRAIFKVIESGRQVAVLVPTTILALQHAAVFRTRLAGYPFTVEALSRVRSRAEQHAVLAATARGGVDVLIGTHRLLSDDVVFRDLGLVVVDEEHRFGVAHKERIKRWRALVDVLTLTATPIPRTLHMALLGLRDISTLTTPPPDRQAVETRVQRFEPDWARDAIALELARGGQVFVVHNRVHGIERVAAEIRALAPEARVEVAHGQLDEHALVARMGAFVAREVDVLVSTAIIESGLDVPSANTMIITDAERYGLADLHQLRGRIGRSGHQGHCYCCLGTGPIGKEAQARVHALEEFAELGAGFALALRDLELRGAGNLLGPEQHGHVKAVGYELYCRLLREASARLGQGATPPPPEVALDFRVAAHLPETYIPDLRQRMVVYRRFGGAETLTEVDAALEEARDRYGPPPPPVTALADLARLRLLAPRAGVAALSETDADVVARYTSEERVRRWRKVHPDPKGLRVVDETTALIAKGPRRGAAVLAFLRESLLGVPEGG